MYFWKASFSGALAASMAAISSVACAQASLQDAPPHPFVTVYVQASDARFDAYLYVKKKVFLDNGPASSDEFFYIPRSNSKEREKELADWRRKFNLIVSAATLSENVQPKISHVKEEFSRANSAAECWTVDHRKERRITVTMIGSASETAIENEYTAVSREFFADAKNFTCKFAHEVAPSTPGGGSGSTSAVIGK
jgi:hypothetical protein